MEIRFKETEDNVSIEIDPGTEKEQRTFSPLISVAAYDLDDHGGDATIARVGCHFSGVFDSLEAELYGEALVLASFICNQANEGDSLEFIYEKLSGRGLSNFSHYHNIHDSSSEKDTRIH